MRPRLNDLPRGHLSVVPSVPSTSELLERYAQVADRQRACDRMVVHLAARERLMMDSSRVPSVASLEELGIFKRQTDRRMAILEKKIAEARRERRRWSWWGVAALVAVLTAMAA